MHFLSISEVNPPKLKTEEKRERLTLRNVDEYNQQIQSSHMLQPDGPFDLIDMHQLTQGWYLMCSASAEIQCTWLAVGLADTASCCSHVSLTYAHVMACKLMCVPTCFPACFTEGSCMPVSPGCDKAWANTELGMQAVVQNVRMMDCIIAMLHTMQLFKSG